MCEGVTLGAVGCGGVVGGGGFGLGCVVSRAGVCGGVVFRAVGQKPSITPPPGNPSPTQRKTSIKHAHMGGVTVYYAFFFKINI